MRTGLAHLAADSSAVVSLSSALIRVRSRLRNVDELINCPLYSYPLFGLWIAMPKGLLLADEYTVRAALCRHGANLRPGIAGDGFQAILNRDHSKSSKWRLGSGC